MLFKVIAILLIGLALYNLINLLRLAWLVRRDKQQSKPSCHCDPTHPTSPDASETKRPLPSPPLPPWTSPRQPQQPGEQASSKLKDVFLIKPHLQLGAIFGAGPPTMEIVWHSFDEPATAWYVHIRPPGGRCLVRRAAAAAITTVDFPTIGTVAAHKQHRALVFDRKPGERFVYELFRDGKLVFAGETAAPKAKGSSFRFVAVGDLGEGNPGQAKVAHQIMQVSPDLIVVPGDMAYKRGLFSENLGKLFPVMNHDVSSPETGAPLLRNFLTVFALGNHCVGRPNLIEIPNFDLNAELFAYFYLWSQPLNGPEVTGGRNAHQAQALLGAEERVQAFLQAAAGRHPRMASFSFDYADSHWLVLDSNLYMDWTDERLRQWVRDDLSRTKATWKFVCFHHPPFTTNQRHRVEQRMRLIADILEETGVDIVWLGHAHWYERMYPIKFAVKPQPDGSLISKSGAVQGDITLDKSFDGVNNTRPNGVLYIVTGGGGAKLHGAEVPAEGWQPFTHKLMCEKHFFTVIDVVDRTLTARIVSEDGAELDRFTVTK